MTIEAFGIIGIVFSYFVVTMLIATLVTYLFSIGGEGFFFVGWAVGFALFTIFVIAFITGNIF